MTAIAPTAAGAEEASVAAGAAPLAGLAPTGSLGEALMPGVARYAEEARLDNPEAVQARDASATEYEGMSPAAAGKLAREAFPGLVDQSAGGLPQLPEGQHVTSIIDAHAERISLPEGGHAIVESAAPIAVSDGSSGGFAPLELGLNEAHGAFVPERSAVPVRVPKNLGEGVSLPELEVSLTPLEASGSGAASASSGTIDGDAVFYGASSMGPNVDALARATSSGVELLAMLRGASSPQRLRYRVGLAQGASLSQVGAGGSVQIVEAGRPIATVPTPSAVDAEDVQVPVSMSVAGDILELRVEDEPGTVGFPVVVDPEVSTVEEDNVKDEDQACENWHYAYADSKYWTKADTDCLGLMVDAPFAAGEAESAAMQTKGLSKVYEVAVAKPESLMWPEFIEEGKIVTADWFDSAIAIEGGDGESESALLTGRPKPEDVVVCAVVGCSPEGGQDTNGVRWRVDTLESSAEVEERGSQIEKEHLSYLLAAVGPTVYISQPKEVHSTVTANYSSREINETNNVLSTGTDLYERWLGPHHGAFEFEASDAGLGVAEASVELDREGKWETVYSKDYLAKDYYTKETACDGVQCEAKQHVVVTYPMFERSLPEGVDTIRAAAHDPMADTSSSEHGEGEETVYVDDKPPHGIALTGLKSVENEAHEQEFTVGEAPVKVQAEASDGEEKSVESSGIRSIGLEVDGDEIGSENGSCDPGPCKATGEWTIDGSELGAGTHTLTVVATDWAGNVASKEYTLDVYPASPVALGPGSVNPESGDFALESSDVEMSGGMGGLSVTRHYDSLDPTEGKEGSLGPQWTLSLGGLASLEVLSDESVMLVGPEGLVHFEKTSSGFEAPTGDQNLTLAYNQTGLHGEPEYLLQNTKKATTTRFTLPKGAESWMPTTSEGPVATDTTTDDYATVEVEGKAIVQPTLEVAPHPSATCEPGNLEQGCRALEFEYASKTTAKGEAASEWGNYDGHLVSVKFVAWNPATKAMKKVTVAQYIYDNKGRLRAEWNPSIEPVLKTIYGYDSEGHITSISPPGQEPWLVRYGTTAADARTGRVLSVSRAKASVKVEPLALAPVSTAAPVLSSVEAGPETTLSVSDGSWSNGPLSYSYQWEECNSSGDDCTAISGAVNRTYRTISSELEHDVVAVVAATNASGTMDASSNQATLSELRYDAVIGRQESIEEGAFKSPQGVAVAENGDVWVADTENDRVQEFGPTGTFIRKFGEEGAGNGKFDKPRGIAVAPSGDVFVADTGNSRVQEFSASGEFIRVFGNSGSSEEKLSKPDDLAIGLDGEVWVADTGDDSIKEFSANGALIHQFGKSGKGVGDLDEPDAIAVTPTGSVWVTNAYEKDRHVEEFSAAGDLLADYEGEKAHGIAVDAYSDVFVAEDSKLTELSPAGVFIAEYGDEGDGSKEFEELWGVAIGPENKLWVADAEKHLGTGTSDVQEFTIPPASPEAAPEPPSEPNNLTTTVEYDVPVSGAGAPHEMTATELAKWGQKDDPVYAMAIFPAEEPEGWPAKEYKRATVDYLDSQGRTVNVAGPSDAIGTTEYDESNNVVRSLSPGNRAKALEAGAESAKISEDLSTSSVYEAEESELEESLGPEHTVKLADGETVQARNHVRYYYDEGAPDGEEGPEEYGLVTKTIDSAQTADGQQRDERVSTTSYTGQEGLGWTLREPTSTTSDPEGLALTSTTIYSETGQVLETRAPGSSDPESPRDTVAVYYTAAPNGTHPACGKHLEWEGLPCMSLPGKQPSDSPRLPETTVEYNIYDQPEKTIEAFGSTTRTQSTTYEESGRPLTGSVTTSGSSDKAVARVTDKYNQETGALSEQISTNEKGEHQTISRTYNTLGQATSYTDAAGNKTTYSYDGYARPSEVNYDATGLDGLDATSKYAYNEETGQLFQLEASGVGAFKASYDVEGQLTKETYPNGMSANYAYNSIGEATSLSYQKTSDCSGKECEWFSDSAIPSIHGEWLTQESSLAKDTYAYDTVGRLTEVQETPAGEGCTVSVYGYDLEGERTSQSTREPGAGGKCATEGGVVQHHIYDEAGRLDDAGVVYEAMGNITSLPAVDAGGSGALESSYYVDGQLASQKQGGITNAYLLDPDGRVGQTEMIDKQLETSVTVSHYAGAAGTPSWTYDETTGGWTRDVMGITGLAAVQEDGKEAVLELSDLQGNVVGTASLSETATKPSTLERSSTFGEPTSSKPEDKLKWLGDDDISSELPSGAIAQDGITYVPQLGRALQTEGTVLPLPENKATPYVSTVESWLFAGAAAESATATASFQEALRKAEEAKRAAEEALRRAQDGSNGNLPSSRSAGAVSEASGTIGDPIRCKVFANEPQFLEEDAYTTHPLEGVAEFSCESTLPKTTWFEVCFMEGGLNRVSCHGEIVTGRTVGEVHIKIECKVKIDYTIKAWLWQVNKPAIKVSSTFAECEEDLVEVGEGHWI